MSLSLDVFKGQFKNLASYVVKDKMKQPCPAEFLHLFVHQ